MRFGVTLEEALRRDRETILLANGPAGSAVRGGVSVTSPNTSAELGDLTSSQSLPDVPFIISDTV